ncbi:MAG: hypothetical protein ACYSUY_08265 [Planctomycetota bacterium]|jgi:hypothetical protein
MAIEAPISKFKRNGLIIWIVVCSGVAIIFGYDGYLSKYEWSLRRSFYEKHVKDGQPDDTMVFNQKSPFFFIGVAVLLGAYWFTIRNKKLIADENELVINDKQRIPYDSIQQLDKTYFKSKGHFVITYKDNNGKEANRKISKKTYDNLTPILDHLVAKITESHQ